MWSPKAPRGALRPPAGAYGACGAGFFFFFSRSHPGKIAGFSENPAQGARGRKEIAGHRSLAVFSHKLSAERVTRACAAGRSAACTLRHFSALAGRLAAALGAPHATKKEQTRDASTVGIYGVPASTRACYSPKSHTQATRTRDFSLMPTREM